MRKAGLNLKQQHPHTVYDEDGTVIGEYTADMLVENRLIIELKACKSLADEHTAQLLGYLKSARIEHGLLMNFGASRFQIKKYAFSDRKHTAVPGMLSSLLFDLFALFAFFRG